MTAVGRLAPTPSGHLHLGNVTAFTAAWLSARSDGGRLLLRFEDLDLGRARPDVEASQRADLAWLGLDVDAEVVRQSARSYADALLRLADHTYRCTCSRAALRASEGRCACGHRGETHGAIRLRLPARTVRFVDRRWGPWSVDLANQADPVLVRADGFVGYTLAVVADDVADGVTEVVRGADLLDATGVQMLLWELLADRTPTWLHTPLVLGPDGRKLSKSHGSTEVRALRAAGWTAADVLGRVLPWLGLPGVTSLRDAVSRWRPDQGPLGPVTVDLTSGSAPPPR